MIIRSLLLASSLVLAATTASAHAPGRGPNGGQIQHLANNTHVEVVAAGNTLRLYLFTPEDAPLPAEGATATALVLAPDGSKQTVALQAAGVNVMQGSGNFTAAAGMKVVVSIAMPGQRPAQGRFTPIE